ncbi:MAG TPA: hypothetical protein VF817_04290 [Patescibacteria group bacterium]
MKPEDELMGKILSRAIAENSKKEDVDSQNKKSLSNQKTSITDPQYEHDLPTAVAISKKEDAEKITTLRKQFNGDESLGAEVISNEKFLLARKKKIEEELDLLANELETRSNRLMPLEDLGGEKAVAGERDKTWDLIEKIAELLDERDRIYQEHEDVVNARIDKELGR